MLTFCASGRLPQTSNRYPTDQCDELTTVKSSRRLGGREQRAHCLFPTRETHGGRARSDRLSQPKCALAVCADPTTGMEVDAAALRAFVDACAWTAHTQAHGVDKIARDKAAVLDACPYICLESRHRPHRPHRGSTARRFRYPRARHRHCAAAHPPSEACLVNRPQKRGTLRPAAPARFGAEQVLRAARKSASRPRMPALRASIPYPSLVRTSGGMSIPLSTGEYCAGPC
jgi:hypothetical protein